MSKIKVLNIFPLVLVAITLSCNRSSGQKTVEYIEQKYSDDLRLVASRVSNYKRQHGDTAFSSLSQINIDDVAPATRSRIFLFSNGGRQEFPLGGLRPIDEGYLTKKEVVVFYEDGKVRIWSIDNVTETLSNERRP